MTQPFDPTPWAQVLNTSNTKELDELVRLVDPNDFEYVNDLFYFLNTAPQDKAEHIHGSLYLQWCLMDPPPAHLAPFFHWGLVTTGHLVATHSRFVELAFDCLLRQGRSDEAIALIEHTPLSPDLLFDLSGNKGAGSKMLISLAGSSMEQVDLLAPVFLSAQHKQHWNISNPFEELFRLAFMRNNPKLLDHLQQPSHWHPPVTPSAVWETVDKIKTIGTTLGHFPRWPASWTWVLEQHLQGNLDDGSPTSEQKDQYFVDAFAAWLPKSEKFFIQPYLSIHGAQEQLDATILMSTIYQNLLQDQGSQLIGDKLNNGEQVSSNWLLEHSSPQTIAEVIQQHSNLIQQLCDDGAIHQYPILSKHVIEHQLPHSGQPSLRSKM